MADEKTGTDQTDDIEDVERPITQSRDDQPFNPPSNPPSNPPVGIDRNQQQDEEPAE